MQGNHHCEQCAAKVDEMLRAEAERRWSDAANIAGEIHAHLCFEAPYPAQAAAAREGLL